ncbi:WYL domain-containing transcriptional regulator [Clostridium carnis]
MSSLKNTIKMLLILNYGKLIKKKELSEKLGVSEKQISRYKEALDEIVTIESIPGPNGGYKLKDKYLPFKQLLTKEEVIILKLAINGMKETFNGDNSKINKAIDKINYSIMNKDNNLFEAQIIPYSKVKENYDNLTKKQLSIYEAILQNKQIIITYRGNDGLKTRRWVEPYKLLIYKGESYLVANCLLKSSIRFFKLVRISEYIITGKSFEKTIDIDKILSDYKDKNIGIFSGKEYNLKLEISPPMANTVKERIWVDNQVIEELDNGKIIFKATMKGSPEITSWILSLKDSVKIIEPESLKKEVKEYLVKMINNL